MIFRSCRGLFWNKFNKFAADKFHENCKRWSYILNGEIQEKENIISSEERWIRNGGKINNKVIIAGISTLFVWLHDNEPDFTGFLYSIAINKLNQDYLAGYMVHLGNPEKESG